MTKKELSVEYRDASASADPGVQTVRISVRFLDAVDLPLRARVMRQGEFVAFVCEAIETTDLAKVPLVVITNSKAKDTTIRVSEPIFVKLHRIAKERKTSVNVLINTAVAHWLDQKQKREVVQFRTDR